MTNGTPATYARSRRAAAIRRAVRAIKRGSFASYGEVARRAGLPGRARLVGQVLRESGDAARLPWHRVTGARRPHRVSGRLAPARANSLRALAREGVKTRGNRARARPARQAPAQALDALLWKM